MVHSPQPCSGPEDYQDVHLLVQQMYAHKGPPVYASIGDIDWWRWGPAREMTKLAQIHLWRNAAQELIGVVWLENLWSQDVIANLFVRPDQPGFEAEMLAWCEDYLRAQKNARPLTLTTSAFTSDSARIAVLQQRDYQQQNTAMIYFSQKPTKELESKPLPEGYIVRSVRGEEDVAARAEVHRAAFHPSRMTPEIYRNLMREAPTYRPDLDVVAVAPDKSFAAYCLVWFDAQNKIGVYEPVGCHPDHRRKGLASAVMYEGLRRLYKLGAQQAFVCTAKDYEAEHFYRAINFQPLDYNQNWKKEL